MYHLLLYVLIYSMDAGFVLLFIVEYLAKYSLLDSVLLFMLLTVLKHNKNKIFYVFVLL